MEEVKWTTFNFWILSILCAMLILNTILHIEAIQNDVGFQRALSHIDINNSNVINVSEHINKTCIIYPFGNEERRLSKYCVVTELYKIYNYNNQSHTYSIEEFFRNGTDCKGIAVTYASILKRLGYKTYLIYQPKHICTGIKEEWENQIMLVNCLENETITGIKEV